MGDKLKPQVLLIAPPGAAAAWQTEVLLPELYEVEAVFPADLQPRLLDGCLPDLLVLDASLPLSELQDLTAQANGILGHGFLPTLILARRSSGTSPDRLAEIQADDLLFVPTEVPGHLHLRIRALLRTKQAVDDTALELQRLTDIGLALTAEHNLEHLLHRIVEEARKINHAEAGTLYCVDRDAGVLRFQIVQNELHGTRIVDPEGNDLPPVGLNPNNVSAYVALTGEIVNIPDVYEAGGFDFSGPRKYDAMTGYRSRSMLVVPIRSREEVIGVLQLINARDAATGHVVPFHGGNVARTCALASQAGVALTNASLINDLQALLEGLIQMMATAIDEKSSYTAGHVQRVTRLATLLAESVNAAPAEQFGGFQFTAHELEELRIAGLLHDIGKIVVPEHVVDKSTKLQTLCDRIDHLRTRFEVIVGRLEIAALEQKLRLALSGASPAELAAVDDALAAARDQTWDDFAFLESINRGGEFMAPEKLDRLAAIAAQTYTDAAGESHPYLTEDEVRNLSISRGTLLPEELAVIRSHAAVSCRLLRQIPFPRQLRKVPDIAGDHHETLNGTGYPTGKVAADLPMQSRILAIADIFDALSAADRPYKKAFTLETCYRILREEAERGRLDPDLVELFVAANCHGRLQSEQPRP